MSQILLIQKGDKTDGIPALLESVFPEGGCVALGKYCSEERERTLEIHWCEDWELGPHSQSIENLGGEGVETEIMKSGRGFEESGRS